MIALFFFICAYMYDWSKSFIWVCDSWNLLFVTAITGFIVGIIGRADKGIRTNVNSVK